MSEKISYNEAVSRLETIVSELEKGGKSLDETLAIFEEGAALLKVCQHELDSAEGRLAELSLEEINSQIKG
jgi:exodeoxyribonuclease VII small subunit